MPVRVSYTASWRRDAVSPPLHSREDWIIPTVASWCIDYCVCSQVCYARSRIDSQIITSRPRVDKDILIVIAENIVCNDVVTALYVQGGSDCIVRERVGRDHVPVAQVGTRRR